MKATAELKMLPVSVLKPAAYNPRKKLKPGDKEYEKIKNSITEFGFADPLVVNADMTIIGGHQRLTVAMELGYTEVPCAVVDIDKTREKALNIALNKITGAWDDSLLADLLKDIEDSDFDLGKTGFDPPEIETLFNKVHSKEVKEDDFDVESELKQPCFSKEGDLWHLGKHIVLCGDSTKAECYNTLMDGTKANLVLSDPPYNVDVEETAGKIMNDNMGDSEFYQFLLAAFQQMHDHLADDGSIYIFHADTEGLNFRKAFKDAGFYLSGCCIWKKNALVLGRSPYQWQHEPCLYGWKQKGKHQWYSDRKQTTIWEYDRPKSIAEDTGEASWIDEGEEIPESDTTFGQTMLSAYKLGTMIKISNELLNDSAFDLATYIARRFGVRMGNAEERAFITGDGVGKPLGLLAETGGAKVGVTAAQKDAVTFDEIFKLYYALKAPYRKKAQFLCNEALVLQLMTIKDNNGNYIWKPGLEIGKPDTLLNRPLKTSAFMPEIKGGSKVMAFGDYSYYWVADRQNRTFRRLNELYARTDQVGFLTTQRVDGKLILPEAVQLLQMAPQG